MGETELADIRAHHESELQALQSQLYELEKTREDMERRRRELLTILATVKHLDPAGADNTDAAG